MANVTSVTKHFPEAKEGFTTTLSSSVSAGAATLPLNSVTGYTNGNVAVLVVDPGDGTKKQVCTGTVDTSGIQLTGVVWTEGTNTAHSAGATVVDYVTATHNNMITKGIKVSLNDDGSLKTAAVQTALGLGNTPTAGWTPMSQTVTTVTYNGNRSYDLVMSASAASILSPGMRLLINKTVAGNTYMGGIFNATNQYFTVSPTGALATITNNFTLMAHIMPTAYVDGIICGRSDAASNNALELRMVSNGTLAVYCFNGGVGNYTAVSTYQSVSLNKKSHVAVTWASGAVALYIDGVSVPVKAPTTSGTAPTTAGTGGDWSVGRKGAYAGNYFAGYISNVAVFNAVLTASLIRQYSTYKSSSSEPSCIGAWSLDNTAVNQVAPGTNDLTAMNGVGYTAASPHGQLSNYIDASAAIALVMAVNGTTVTVQTPEGVTIPTTGGITSVSYATSGVPFGWVSDKNRWNLYALKRTDSNQASPGNGATYNLGGLALTVPVGAFSVWSDSYVMGRTGSPTSISVQQGFSTTSNSFTDIETNNTLEINSAVTVGGSAILTKDYTLTAPQTFYLNAMVAGSGLTNLDMWGSRHQAKLWAVPAGV